MNRKNKKYHARHHINVAAHLLKVSPQFVRVLIQQGVEWVIAIKTKVDSQQFNYFINWGKFKEEFKIDGYPPYFDDMFTKEYWKNLGDENNNSFTKDNAIQM